MLLGARPNWPFTIIEEPGVTAMLAQARDQFPRFDEIWDGIIWLLAHAGHKLGMPKDFGRVGHRVYVYDGDRVAGFPHIFIVYRQDVDTFILKVISISEP